MKLIQTIIFILILSLHSCKPEPIDRKISPELKALVYDSTVKKMRFRHDYMDSQAIWHRDTVLLSYSIELRTVPCSLSSDCRAEEVITRVKDSSGKEVFSYRLDLTGDQPTIHIGYYRVDQCQIKIRWDNNDVDLAATNAVNRLWVDSISSYYSPSRRRVYAWVTGPPVAVNLDNRVFSYLKGLGVFNCWNPKESYNTLF